MPGAKKSNQASKRQRGRPQIDGELLAERQALVLDAAGQLLADKASSEITVEQLIQAAGTSRPTFYRWFPGGTEQVLDMLIKNANEELMIRLLAILNEGVDLSGRIEAGIRAYFEWGKEMGPVVYGIYRDGFVENSTAWKYRQQTLAAVFKIMSEQADELGFAYVSDLAIETLLSWVESAGATLFRRYPISSEAIDEQCWLTTEMALAMLSVMQEKQNPNN